MKGRVNRNGSKLSFRNMTNHASRAKNNLSEEEVIAKEKERKARKKAAREMFIGYKDE
jgi:hypothetical protein